MMSFLASLSIVHNEAKTLRASYDTMLNPFLISNSGEIFYVLLDKFTLVGKYHVLHFLILTVLHFKFT
jgi:hypothetical protein